MRLNQRLKRIPTSVLRKKKLTFVICTQPVSSNFDGVELSSSDEDRVVLAVLSLGIPSHHGSKVVIWDELLVLGCFEKHTIRLFVETCQELLQPSGADGENAHLHDKVPPSFFALGTLHFVFVQLADRLQAVEFGKRLLEILVNVVIQPEME